MRLGSLLLLLMLCLPATLMAEETTSEVLAEPSASTPAAPNTDALEASQLRDEAQRQAAQLQRVRQENQRLKLQLKEAQASSTRALPLLSEQQTWFAIGAAVSLLGVILGALLRTRRASRREWLN